MLTEIPAILIETTWQNVWHKLNKDLCAPKLNYKFEY